MATENEIAATLKTLADYYAGQNIELGAIQVYLDNLADIPAWLLEQAARRHIRRSAWFPKVSELRESAEKLAGARDFTGLETLPPDLLFREARLLEDAFYHRNHLDPQEWERLAARYDQAGRANAAEACRHKLAAVLQLHSRPPLPLGEGRGEGASPIPVVAASAAPQADAAWTLIAEAQELEDAFFAEGRLDPAEWQRLAVQFERLDRPYRAEDTREKLRCLQTIRMPQS